MSNLILAKKKSNLVFPPIIPSLGTMVSLSSFVVASLIAVVLVNRGDNNDNNNNNNSIGSTHCRPFAFSLSSELLALVTSRSRVSYTLSSYSDYVIINVLLLLVVVVGMCI